MNAPRSLFEVRRDSRFVRWRPYLGHQAQRVRDFAQSFYDEHGIEPTYNQICNALDIPTKAQVSRIVANLERRGEVQKRDGHGPRLKLVNR